MAHADVFISYLRSDHQVATALADELDMLDVTTWSDFNNLTPGENFIDAINAALNGAKAIVVILSEATQKSRWVRNEVMGAVAAGALVIPVVVSDGDAALLPIGLKSIQAIFFGGNPNQKRIHQAAMQIASALRNTSKSNADVRLPHKFASDLAQEAEKTGDPATPDHASGYSPRTLK